MKESPFDSSSDMAKAPRNQRQTYRAEPEVSEHDLDSLIDPLTGKIDP